MFAVPWLFTQLCSRRSTICTRRMLTMGRRRIDRDHVESHKLHWVANLPDHEHASLFKRVLAHCPKKTEGATLNRKQARKLALYADILIPILERDGSVPQDEHFQEMINTLGFNAYKISDILEYHYDAIRNHQPSHATA